MIRFELQDDEVFFDVLHTFQEQYGDSVARGVDFQEVIEDVSGQDFSDFFEQWYFGEGFPKYSIVWNQSEGNLNMNITQTTSSNNTTLFKMLMPYRLNFDDGSDSTILLYQTDNYNFFSVPISQTIDSISVDPENWNLYELINISVGIEERESPAYFTFGPNPVQDQVRIFLPNENGNTYQVIINDMAGRELFRQKGAGNETLLNLENIMKGIYLISIQNGQYISSKKFVKM